VTADGCLDTLWCQTVAAGEVPSEKKDWLKVWPNPAGDLLNIETLGFPEAEVVLYNSQGRVVYREKMAGRTALPSASLPAGLYFLEIREGQRVVSRQKVIIAH
jgi:hypothetical protein